MHTGLKIGLLASVLVAGALYGQEQAPPRTASSRVLDWSADTITANDASKRVTLAGNVSLTKGDIRMNAARVGLAYTGGIGSGDVTVTRVDASGGVRFVTNSKTATGQIGIYDVNADVVTMVGNVELRQNGNVFRGERLVVNLRDNNATLSGNQSNSPTGGRVSGRFLVPERTNPAPN